MTMQTYEAAVTLPMAHVMAATARLRGDLRHRILAEGTLVLPDWRRCGCSRRWSCRGQRPRGVPVPREHRGPRPERAPGPDRGGLADRHLRTSWIRWAGAVVS